jgi:hypothetical protein
LQLKLFPNIFREQNNTNRSKNIQHIDPGRHPTQSVTGAAANGKLQASIALFNGKSVTCPAMKQ